jgi:hypothetical protein
MAATGARVTMFFQDDVFGFSETHDYLGVTELVSPQADTKLLIKARMLCMGQGILFVGCRLSLEGVFRDSELILAADLGNLPTQSTTQTGAGVPDAPPDPDQAKSCLLLRLEATSIMRRPLYMAGVPDAVIGENPRVNRARDYASWYNAFQAWGALLSNGKWGSVFRTPRGGPGGNPEFNVQGVLNDPNTGEFSIIMNDADVTFAAQQKIQLRLFQMTNRNYLPANGVWQIHAVNLGPGAGQHTYALWNSSKVTAPTIKLPGVARLVNFVTAAYDGPPQIIGQTTRKRGNRFLTGPGRRTIRKYVNS